MSHQPVTSMMIQCKQMKDPGWNRNTNDSCGEQLGRFRNLWRALSYMGDYLLEPVVGNGNELYLIYHVKVRDQYSNDDGSYDKVNDVYWYMHYGTILADGEGNTDIDLSDYGTPGNFFKIKTDAKTDGISSMVWKYYGYPTLDDLYADVVGDNADYSLVEDA